MAWSGDFSSSADPLTFDPGLNSDDWKTKSSSTTSVPSLETLINKVVTRINSEGKYINPSYSVSLNQLKSSIAGNYSGMTYQQRFQAVVDAGRAALEKLRNTSVDEADFSSFYKRYYFYTPTTAQLNQIKTHFYEQDYGFGQQGKEIEKTAALNRSVSTGFLPDTTTLEQFESFTSEQNKALLVSHLEKINGSGDSAIIDPEILKKSPLQAANALMQLAEDKKLSLNSLGQYEWKKGANWRDLKNFDDGGLLNTYQKLVTGYESSDAKANGQTLSQYIASKNKAVFDEISKKVASEKQVLDTSAKNVGDAKTIIETVMQSEIDKAVKTLGVDAAETQTKIAALRADAFKQVSAQLALQQSSESNRKSLELFTQTNSIFQEMAQDLGVKSDFFSNRLLQSNIAFNWQNWFEKELRQRYDPKNSNSAIGNIIGTSPEDASLAANFVQNFLQRRFDASKSLSEFKEYINPSSSNAVLETSQEAAWKKLTSSGFTQVAGDINNPTTALGNFWTNLQNLWSKGRQFDTTFYLGQQLSGTSASGQTVKDLHDNLTLMYNQALKKDSSNLTATDIKSLDLKGVNKDSETDLAKQVALFKQWLETSYANGVDLTDPIAFAKLHYSTYTKDPSNTILQVEKGKKLTISDTDLLSNTEAQMLSRQAEVLISQASDYATEIQFGKFKTPEEYVAEMMKKSPIYAMSKDGTWDGTGLTDIMSEFVSQYTGVISSYAGEAVRKQIREALASNQKPGQDQLGVDFIQRTKDQALSTIRNLINQDAYQKAVVIDNVAGPSIGESLKDWFSGLGLELVPGKTWDDFKKANNIDANMSYQQWQKSQGEKIDPNTNKPNSQVFWEKWAKDNGINVISNGDSKDPRLTIVVEEPTSAWLSWGKRITMDIAKKDAYTTEKLNGAKVSIRSDQFNADWYSKTNPYTKVVDEWNSIVARPSQRIINTSGKDLGIWAKESGLSPESAWTEYRNEQQKTKPGFGKDSTGNDLSYISWSQKASPSEVDQFWRKSSPYWFQYLKDLKVVKGGTEADPKFKTWSEWSIENGISLTRASLANNQPPPEQFMQLHYSAMGGKAKVDSEYLKTYFPEFQQLESKGYLGQAALTNSPFNLSDFGFTDETSVTAMQPVTQSSRKSVSPIDFAMKQMFGDSLSQDNSDPFADLMDATKTDFGSDLGVKLDTSYNKTTAKKKTSLADFGFGDFGGSNFGF